MKVRARPLFRGKGVMQMAVLGLATMNGYSAVLEWDADLNTPGVQGGSGRAAVVQCCAQDQTRMALR